MGQTVCFYFADVELFLEANNYYRPKKEFSLVYL